VAGGAGEAHHLTLLDGVAGLEVGGEAGQMGHVVVGAVGGGDVDGDAAHRLAGELGLAPGRGADGRAGVGPDVVALVVVGCGVVAGIVEVVAPRGQTGHR